MTDPIAIAAAAMRSDALRLDIIGQNLANANTVGYKRDIPVSRSFNNVIDQVAPQYGVPSIGPDVLGGETLSHVDVTVGVLKRTGNGLDIAIEGKGFFEITTPDGAAYTRAGSFMLDSLGRLTTAEGWPVNSVEGDMRLHGTEPVIDRDGYIWEGGSLVGQLRIVEFDRDVRFEKAGGKLLVPIGNVDAMETAAPTVRQGFVETSNVDAAQEMVRMMEAVRHFESAQRVITGYDEMLGTAINSIAEF